MYVFKISERLLFLIFAFFFSIQRFLLFVCRVSNVHAFVSFSFIYYQLIAGYGLTETSPVICNQLVEHKVLGCIGESSIAMIVTVFDLFSG